jgi:hypothetical protein
VAVPAATARLALITARLLRRIRATRLRAETTLVLSRRAALQRRVRMRTARTRTVLARARRGTISVRQLLRVRRLRARRTPRTGVAIVRRHGSLVRPVHLVRRVRPLRVRIVSHNGRLHLRHSAAKALRLHDARVRPRHSAKVLLRHAARVRPRRNGRKLLRSRSVNLESEKQWIVLSGQWLV